MKRPERIETVVLNTAPRWSSLQVQHHHRVSRTKKTRPGAVLFSKSMVGHLSSCQISPGFPLTKPISCENDLYKTGLTARPLLVWPPDHNNWPRSATWHA